MTGQPVKDGAKPYEWKKTNTQQAVQELIFILCVLLFALSFLAFVGNGGDSLAPDHLATILGSGLGALLFGMAAFKNRASLANERSSEAATAPSAVRSDHPLLAAWPGAVIGFLLVPASWGYPEYKLEEWGTFVGNPTFWIDVCLSLVAGCLLYAGAIWLFKNQIGVGHKISVFLGGAATATLCFLVTLFFLEVYYLVVWEFEFQFYVDWEFVAYLPIPGGFIVLLLEQWRASHQQHDVPTPEPTVAKQEALQEPVETSAWKQAVEQDNEASKGAATPLMQARALAELPTKAKEEPKAQPPEQALSEHAAMMENIERSPQKPNTLQDKETGKPDKEAKQAEKNGVVMGIIQQYPIFVLAISALLVILYFSSGKYYLDLVMPIIGDNDFALIGIGLLLPVSVAMFGVYCFLNSAGVIISNWSKQAKKEAKEGEKNPELSRILSAWPGFLLGILPALGMMIANGRLPNFDELEIEEALGFLAIFGIFSFASFILYGFVGFLIRNTFPTTKRVGDALATIITPPLLLILTQMAFTLGLRLNNIDAPFAINWPLVGVLCGAGCVLAVLLDCWVQPASETTKASGQSASAADTAPTNSLAGLVLPLAVVAGALGVFWMLAREGDAQASLAVLGLAAVAVLLIEYSSRNKDAQDARLVHVGRLRFLRVTVGVASLVGIAFALPPIAENAERAYRIGEGDIGLTAEDADFKATIVASLADAVRNQDYDAEVMAAINEGDIFRAEALVGLADASNFITLEPGTRAKFAETQSAWSRFWRGLDDCASGALLRYVTNVTEIGCMLGLDFTIPWLGDTIDITQQLSAGDERDELVLAIASISLGIQAYDALFEQDAHALTTGVKSLGITARAAKGLKVSPAVQNELTAMLLKAKPTSNVMSASVKQLQEVQPLIDQSARIAKHSDSWATPIVALKASDDLADLALYERTARVFGKQTDGVVSYLGKGVKRAATASAKGAAKLRNVPGDLFAWLSAGVVGLALSLSSTLSKSVFMGLIRRRERQLSAA